MSPHGSFAGDFVDPAEYEPRRPSPHIVAKDRIVEVVGFTLSLRKEDEVTLTRPIHEVGDESYRLVLKALNASQGRFDFRTLASLSDELLLPVEEVRQALDRLISEGTVRRPITAQPQFAHWYRLTSEGLTRREKWNRLRFVASRT